MSRAKSMGLILKRLQCQQQIMTFLRPLPAHLRPIWKVIPTANNMYTQYSLQCFRLTSILLVLLYSIYKLQCILSLSLVFFFLYYFTEMLMFTSNFVYSLNN